MIDKIKNMDKKMKLYLIIGASAIIFIILLLIILKIAVGSTINSRVFESRLKNAAISYYEKYPNKLPKLNGEKVSVTIDELVNAGNLKSLDKLLDKGLTCSGNVSVSNNNSNYLYQPIIECSDKYKTNLLYNKIIEDNPVVTSSDGLYKVNDYYLFRGEKLNNYVKFADKNWRILRINNDNTIRLILLDNLDTVSWDDRYNSDKQENIGKNIYSISRIKETLDNYFNGDKSIFKKEDKALIVPSDLCIGARNENATVMDGSIECANKLEKQPLGLLQVNEYPIISLDSGCRLVSNNQCTNYNYLSTLNNFWTLTANTANSYTVYRVSRRVEVANAESYAVPRIVLNITSDALYTKGNGTENNPYIIK